MSIQSLLSIQSLSLLLLLVGIGLAFSQIRLSGWILGWILLSGAVLLQGFRSMLSYFAGQGGVDATTYAIANDWMGLGFSLLVVAAMHMMREVFARHRLAAESLHVVSAAANDAIIIMDNTGTIANWNHSAQRIFGHSARQAQGRKLVELIVPQRCRIEFQDMFNHFGSDGREALSSAPAELAGLRGDGTEIVTEYSIARVIIDGKWYAIYIVRDISARKQADAALRAREERFRVLFDRASDGILIVSPEGELVALNESFARMHGYTTQAMLAMTLKDLDTPESFRLMPDRMQRILSGGSTTFEVEHYHKDGHVFPLEVSSSLIVSDGESLIQSFVRDITERKRAEAELLRSNSELEQFSYSISHDMRQPLRMISSYLQLLEASLADKLDAEKREYFDFAVDGAKRLDQMLVALLEYSRIGRKGEPPVWVKSRAVLGEALLFLQPAIAEAQANVHIEGDWPRILVSPDEMLRLLQNLISNAVKFRVAGRTPEITVASEIAGNEWRVRVADNGIGIIPDQIGRLFHVFQRLQSRANYEGTGIGLALCRKIVERHGGRIWAESAGESQGCTFTFTLPMSAKGAR